MSQAVQVSADSEARADAAPREVPRLLAVHAHPDDESSKGAATTAKYAADGARVMVVTLTGGERGDILNPAMDLPDVHGRMAEIRRDEMRKAAEILGVEHHWLGFVDSGLPEGDPPPPLARWFTYTGLYATQGVAAGFAAQAVAPIGTNSASDIAGQAVCAAVAVFVPSSIAPTSRSRSGPGWA